MSEIHYIIVANIFTNDTMIFKINFKQTMKENNSVRLGQDMMIILDMIYPQILLYLV